LAGRKGDPPAFQPRRLDSPACCLTLMRSSQQGNARHTDLFLALACLRNVVRRLHTHQRIHLHFEGFLDSAEGKLLTQPSQKQIKAVGKTLRGKVPFPRNLQTPHNTRDSHFPTASTATDFMKPDISFVLKSGYYFHLLTTLQSVADVTLKSTLSMNPSERSSQPVIHSSS
jgi:hypothetical protein